MPPNTSSGTILDQFECSYKQAANPYSETKDACCEECPGPSGSRGTRGHEAAEPEVEDTVRVTTRARLTYELYKYSKNAMLIVTTRPDPYTPTGLVDEFRNTFEKFRFEVDVDTASNKNDLYSICDRFFQRDFTEYGAVALVILTAMGVNQRQPGLKFEKRCFKESVILDNFKLEKNPTLANKPKIYITEARRRLYETPLVNVLSQATHGDVISFILPESYEKAVRNFCLEKKLNPEDVLDGPLKIFCEKLSALGDSDTLPAIIENTLEYFYEKHSVFSSPVSANNPIIKILKRNIEVVNTLSKELYLARVEDQ